MQVPEVIPPSTSSEVFLDRDQLAALLRVTRRTLQIWQARGDHPPYFRAGRRKVLYRQADVSAWLDCRIKRSQYELANSRLAA